MAFSINGRQLQYTAKDLFNALDAKDGAKDGKIMRDSWNGFAQIANGRTINYCILEENAVKSINAYLRRSDDNIKAEMLSYLGLEVNDSPKPAKEAEPVQEPKKDITQNKQVQDNNKPQQEQVSVEPKKVNEVQSSPFGELTTNLNGLSFKHDTTILDIAQDSLGLYEISYKEYLKLKEENPEELQNTQYKVIGNHGSITDAWCAHTVSYLAKEAGMNIGAHKSSVQGFIDWAGTDYKQINMKPMTKDNYLTERENRAKQIESQLPNMREGDFIIWKANASNGGTYLVDTGLGNMKSLTSSHIGIIENIDLERGIITVIEGNANQHKSDGSLNRSIVTNYSEGINGAQSIGEIQEVNRRDGLIRKQYTIEELAALGYSGYIDNSSRVTNKS